MFRFIELLLGIGRHKDTPFPVASAGGAGWQRPEDGRPGDLAEDQIRHIHKTWTCPYCRSAYGLIEGPRGGASLNLFCGDPDCDSRFNIIDPKFGYLPIGQFLGPCPPDFIERRREEIRYADEGP